MHDLSEAGYTSVSLFTENDLWCSLIRVSIVASVPGGHCGRDMLKWGHMKLRKVDTKLTNILYCFYSFT